MPIPPGADQRIGPFLREVIDLIDGGDKDEAIARIETRLARQPGDPAALLGLGHVAFLSDQITLTLDALQHALASAPTSAAAAEALAILYALAGEVAEATYYAKLAQANGLDETTAELFPRGWPTFSVAFQSIGERPFMAKGIEALGKGNVTLAIKLLEAQAAFSPNDGETQRALADAQLANGAPRRAAEILSRFAANGTADSWDLARLARALAESGDTLAAHGLLAEARGTIAEGAETEIACAGLAVAMLDPATPTDDHDLRRMTASWDYLVPAAVPLVRKQLSLGERPRIGVLATSLGHERDIDTIAALAQGLRDGSAGEIVLFGAGPLHAPHNRLLQGRVSQHIDAAGFDDETLAHTIAAEGLDLLLDAGGIAAPLHRGALSRHPAPWVAGWLNLPFIADGAVMDAVLDGLLARLEVAPRVELDNPVPLIGADILPGQLHDDLLDAWTAILRRVPEARLLLRDREFGHPENVAPLIERCTALGIADRIEIVAGTDTAFAADLDLLLAPFSASSGHDVLTAASVATPSVAFAGTTRHRRFGAGTLAALGLADFVAPSIPAYVDRAVHLIGRPGDRQAARHRVAEAIARADAFAPTAFAARLLDTLRQGRQA